MLILDNVTKKFGPSFTAVDRLSLHIKPGQIVGFAGENGAGKTTTIKMITGVLSPTDGNIAVCGHDIEKQPIEAKKSIAYVADNPDVFLRLSGYEFINLMADIYNVSEEDRKMRIEETGRRFDILDALHNPMNDCSHGMRQKIMIMAALIHNPPVWILDEPMTGLDPRSAFELKQMMKEHARKGNCVFFSTHVLEVAEELCNEIVIIRKGKTACLGTLAELKDRHPGLSLEEIFIQMNRNDTAEP